jgi:hypothetical protein
MIDPIEVIVLICSSPRIPPVPLKTKGYPDEDMTTSISPRGSSPRLL